LNLYPQLETLSTFYFFYLKMFPGMAGRVVEERVEDVDEVDFSLREHTERSKAVWSTASFQLKLVKTFHHYDDYDDDDDDEDVE